MKKNNSKILVSVIIPIYNVERYLSKCVDSVVSQTHSNLEIILVDDDSPDGSAMICDLYAANDSRVQVIHKKNGGLSDARNAGLLQSKGEYVVFIDGDDYVDKSYIKTLLDNAVAEGADIASCSYFKVYGNKNVQQRKSANYSTFTNVEAMRDIFIFPSLLEVVTWNKIYKKNLFTDNQIVFPVGKIHEDNFTTYKLFYFAKKIIFINSPLYFYVQRAESIINSSFKKTSWNIIEASYEAMDWIKDKNLALEKEVLSYQFNVAIHLLNMMVDKNANDNEFWKTVVSWILKNRKNLNNNSYIGLKQKFIIYTLMFGKLPYILLRSVYTLDRTRP